jgi:small subunit ribosomal protein S2
MPYVNHRWLGGLLTNFQTINQRIKRLHDLERYETEGQLELLPTRERMAAQADLAKLRANLGGVKNMQRPPDAMFVIDLKTEVIAVQEARRLRIPIIGLVDTNCDPDGIDYVIPGNDDAIRACAVITRAIGDVVTEGHNTFRAQEEKARQEAEEKARAEAEARAKRDAEEKERREAEQRAAAEAQAAQAAQGAQGQPAAQAGQAQQAPPQQAAPAAEAQRRETLVTAEGGGDKNVAEAEVAAAVQEGGRPQPDPKVAPEANRDVVQPAQGNEGGTSPEPAPAAEAGEPITNADISTETDTATDAPAEQPADAAADTPTETS